MSSLPPNMTRPYSADALLKKKNFPPAQGHAGHGSFRNNSDIEAILNSRRKNHNTERSKNSSSFFQLGISRASTPSLLYRDRPDTAPTQVPHVVANQESQSHNESRVELKPAKKINTDNLAKTAYSLKVKQEEIEDKIKRLENWQDSMKRNEIWNTPSAHIVKAVLEFSSQNNPNGIVSQYLHEEKEKKALRSSRKVRYSKTPNPRKSATVEQFFKDDEVEVTREITSIIKSGPARRAVSREEVTQKLNSYLTVMKSFQSNPDGKDSLTPRQMFEPITPANEESEEHEVSNLSANRNNEGKAESTLQTDRHPGLWESNSEMLSNKLGGKKKEFLSSSIPLRMSSEGLYRRSAGVVANRIPVQMTKSNPSLERSASEAKVRMSHDQSTSTIRPQTKGTLFTNNQLPMANFVNRPMIERDLNARKFFEGKRGFSRKDQDVRTLSIDSRYLKSYKPGIMIGNHHNHHQNNNHIQQNNNNPNAPQKSVLRSWVSIHNQTENSNMMYDQSNQEVKV